MDFDIGGLSLESTQWLMNHDPGMRQAVTFILGTAGEQQRTHTGGLAQAYGADVRLDELHGVVNGQSRCHGTTG